MEKNQIFKWLGLGSAAVCLFFGFFLNPFVVEIYFDFDWRITSFIGLLLTFLIEILLFGATWFLFRFSAIENFSERNFKKLKTGWIYFGSFFLLFFAIEFFVSIYSPRPENYQYSFLAEDSILGWKSKPNDTISIPLEGKRAKIVINENGFRGITAAKSWGCYSIWGDEQVFGWPASGRMLFTELLNRNAGSGDLSFFNYGIPGYSPLQQLVLYKKLRNKLKCDTLVWVFNSRNDIQDLERNSFYYFFNRPFASVQDRQIKQTDPAWGFREKFRKALIYNLPESHNLNYLKNDFLKPKPEDWSNPNDFFDRISPNGDSSLPKLLELIVRDFSREIREDNRVLIVALLPSPAMIERKLSGPRDGFSNGEDLVFLNDYFDKLSMRYKFFFIDLSPAFFLEHQAGKILFDEEDGSLTEAGQVLLARCMFMLRQEINKPLGQGNWVRKNRLRV